MKCNFSFFGEEKLRWSRLVDTEGEAICLPADGEDKFVIDANPHKVAVTVHVYTCTHAGSGDALCFSL